MLVSEIIWATGALPALACQNLSEPVKAGMLLTKSCNLRHRTPTAWQRKKAPRELAWRWVASLQTQENTLGPSQAAS